MSNKADGGYGVLFGGISNCIGTGPCGTSTYVPYQKTFREKCYDNSGLIFLGFLVLLACACIYAWYKCDMNQQADWGRRATAFGYHESSNGDINVFLSAMNLGWDDFLDSPSLRKQYESWKTGKITLDAKPAQSSGSGGSDMATGLLLGTVIGGSK